MGPLPAGETVRLHIGEHHIISARYDLGGFDDQQLDAILRTNGEGPHFRQQLAPIFEAKRKLADTDSQLAAKAQAMDEIGKDQQRPAQ
jgi:hypothetical protein